MIKKAIIDPEYLQYQQWHGNMTFAQTATPTELQRPLPNHRSSSTSAAPATGHAE